MSDFAERLLEWHAEHGRKDLPWQRDITPYRVWVSEIMLQQTQVATVIDYYRRFMDRFPDVSSLAAAHIDDVLHLWTGLGYYARARNLHKTATIVAEERKGRFPATLDELISLPGIGRSTAGAILSISMDRPTPILDGNVKRVLCRYHAIEGHPGTTENSKRLWQLAEAHTPSENGATYTQAIMDLGATLCTRRNPDCARCPFAADCAAYLSGRTHLLPEPKPKKEKPVRQARFFICVSPEGEVLMQRRPMDGLWGGLWNPLERDPDTAAERVTQELGLTQQDIARMHTAPVFRNTFTHFHLDIEPIYLFLNRLPDLLEDNAERRWIHPEQTFADNSKVGLTKPAVKLLASLKEPFSA